MNEADLDRVERMFADAIDCAPEARDAFLDRACGGDATLRARVESLLDGHCRAVESEFMRVSNGVVGQGQRIGRYRIDRVLATRGMGTV